MRRKSQALYKCRALLLTKDLNWVKYQRREMPKKAHSLGAKAVMWHLGAPIRLVLACH